MPAPTTPPSSGPAGTAAAKKKRQRLIIIGAAGVAIVLFLYMRSKSSSSSTSPNSTSAIDAQTAAAQAAQQQQAADAAMYGYGGSGAGAGSAGSGSGTGSTVDTSGITAGLDTINTDLQNVLAGQQTIAGAIGSPPAATAPTATPPVTINVNGQPAGTSPTSKKTIPAGDISAPFGHNKPAAPAGYTAVGLGSGYWAFRPNARPPVKPTGSTSHAPKPKRRVGP